MEASGERFIPDSSGDSELEHLHRYLLARRLVAGKRVLDIACGEGYGSKLLAEVAATVSGVDISEEAISHAAKTYLAENVDYLVGDCANIPFRDASFDVVVSFETIEHHDRHEEMIREIRRVLRENGLLIISSPEKKFYSDVRNFKNEFHVKELYGKDFVKLLKQSFANVEIFSQRLLYGSAIFSASSQRKAVTYSKVNNRFIRSEGVRAPLYLVALASAASLPDLPQSVYETSVSNSDSMMELTRNSSELEGKLAGTTTAFKDRDSKLEQAKAETKRLSDLLTGASATVESLVIDRDNSKAEVAQLQRSLEALSSERGGKVSRLERGVTERDEVIANLGRTVESLVIDRDSQKAGLEQLQRIITRLTQEREDQIGQLNQVIVERDAVISTLKQTVESLIIDRDSQKTGLEILQGAFASLASERDEQVSRLNREIAERVGSAAELNIAVESLVIDRDSQKTKLEKLQGAFAELASERDEQASRLNREIAERDGSIISLGKTVESLVIDRDSQRTRLEQLHHAFAGLANERDDQVSQMGRLVAERASQIENLKMELSAVYSSRSWRVTAPLRSLVRGVSRINVRTSRNEGRQVEITTIAPHRKVEGVNEIPDWVAPKPGDRTFRILLVSHYCPTRAHAGGLRILDIYSLIRQQCPNVQLDLLTHHKPEIDWSLDDVHRVFHNVYLSPVEDLTPDSLAALRGSPLTYNVVDLQFHQSAHQMDAFRRIGNKIIFTPMESLTKLLFIDFRSKYQMPYALRLIRMAASIRAAAEEIGFTQKADEVVCVSRADAAFLRALTSSRRIRGIDTGISQFEFADALAPGFTAAAAADRRCSVLYVAYFGSETNVVALRWYLEHVHPLVKASVPGYVLTVVGRGDMSSFSKYRDSSVEFVGAVPAIAPPIKEARVAIAPALGGSGFRGKVNQYAVMGVPCVVSPIAFKGLAYQDGVSIFIAETPELFADRCITLLTDLDLNDRMGQAARQLCMERYSWQSKWAVIRKVYQLEAFA